MSNDEDIKKLTKQELLKLYESLVNDYIALEEENEKLAYLASKAVEGMKNNRILVENNQRIIDELLQIIQKNIDSNFSIDEIPRFKS